MLKNNDNGKINLSISELFKYKDQLLSRNNYFRVAYLKKNPYIQAIYSDIIIKKFIKF